MKYDVFISYSSRNQDVANAICHVLEENMLKCWMAPRDIPVGSKYASVIKDAIVSSKVFLLVFSEYAAVSPWVESELNIAFSNRKTIIPYKVDKALVEDYDEFYVRLNNRHWIDSFPDFHERFNELIQVVSANVSVKLPSHHSVPAPSKPVAPVEPKPVERTWNVGDYYDVDGKKGIVFWVDASGKHGKIVSLDEAEVQWCTTSLYHDHSVTNRLVRLGYDNADGYENSHILKENYNWYSNFPALAWCAQHGTEWYIPSIKELISLLSDDVYQSVNRILFTYGKALQRKNTESRYWSSTVGSNSSIRPWIYHLLDKQKYLKSGFERHYVRAISAF